MDPGERPEVLRLADKFLCPLSHTSGQVTPLNLARISKDGCHWAIEAGGKGVRIQTWRQRS